MEGATWTTRLPAPAVLYGPKPPRTGKRGRLCPWYTTKTEPSPADMLARLRREFLKARSSVIKPGHAHLEQIDDYDSTCDIIAA